jgi:hypothetical protein
MKMIRIEDTNYYIDADTRNFILIRWEGKTRLRRDVEGMADAEYFYYSLFVNLLEGLAKHLSRDKISVCKTLEDIRQAVMETNAIVDRIGERTTANAIISMRQRAPEVGQ